MLGIAFTDDMAVAIRRGDKTETRRIRKPRYKVGDTLYVKEALMNYKGRIRWRSDETFWCYRKWKWKRDFLPAMFMPRKAARTFIQVLEIREERLWDITDAAARLEGVAHGGAFAKLWGTINTKPGFQWKDNPNVWVTRFVEVDRP